MFTRLRFWLSYKLLVLGVKVVPDERIRQLLTINLAKTGEDIIREIEGDCEVDKSF